MGELRVRQEDWRIGRQTTVTSRSVVSRELDKGADRDRIGAEVETCTYFEFWITLVLTQFWHTQFYHHSHPFILAVCTIASPDLHHCISKGPKKSSTMQVGSIAPAHLWQALQRISNRKALGRDGMVHATTPCSYTVGNVILDFMSGNRSVPPICEGFATREAIGVHALMPPPVGTQVMCSVLPQTWYVTVRRESLKWDPLNKLLIK